LKTFFMALNNFDFFKKKFFFSILQEWIDLNLFFFFLKTGLIDVNTTTCYKGKKEMGVFSVLTTPLC
jgi:hypothetical protein